MTSRQPTITVILAFTAALVLSCDLARSIDPDHLVPVQSVEINGPSSVSISAGLTHALNATIMPPDVSAATITWRSSNPDVATVDAAGVITALAPGSTQVSAAHDASGKSDAISCTITSVPPVDVTKLIITGGMISGHAGAIPDVPDGFFRVYLIPHGQHINGSNIISYASLREADGSFAALRNFATDDLMIHEGGTYDLLVQDVKSAYSSPVTIVLP
jgi:hypothetical protein